MGGIGVGSWRTAVSRPMYALAYRRGFKENTISSSERRRAAFHARTILKLPTVDAAETMHAHIMTQNAIDRCNVPGRPISEISTSRTNEYTFFECGCETDSPTPIVAGFFIFKQRRRQPLSRGRHLVLGARHGGGEFKNPMPSELTSIRRPLRGLVRCRLL